eukprot:5018764-Pyramimonas_sp.AAC.1
MCICSQSSRRGRDKFGQLEIQIAAGSIEDEQLLQQWNDSKTRIRSGNPGGGAGDRGRTGNSRRQKHFYLRTQQTKFVSQVASKLHDGARALNVAAAVV